MKQQPTRISSTVAKTLSQCELGTNCFEHSKSSRKIEDFSMSSKTCQNILDLDVNPPRLISPHPIAGCREISSQVCLESVAGVNKMSMGNKWADNTSQLLDQLLTNYDKRLRPDFGGEPILVDVNLNVRSMGPITERDMAYQMDCYFRQSWVDKRLRYTGNDSKVLTVSNRILERIWKPDTHFYNGKKSYLHMVTFPNKFFRIANTGKILYSMRLTIKASCPMHLEKFPMDTQDCPLKIGSHGYTVHDLVYEWTNGAGKSIKMASDMRLSQFDLIGYPQANETYKRPGGGIHSSLSARFLMRRHMGYFLINVYVPCSLMVVISWVAFWINREATADRIALGVTTVLTMAFLGLDNRNDLPKVSYSTALDYFVGTCFAFVLASIIQFAGVHYFTKHGSGEVPPLFMQYSSSEEEEEVDEEDVIENGDKENHVELVKSHLNGSINRRCHHQHYPPLFRGRRKQRRYSNVRDNCLLQFWNCVKGSASYKRHRQKTSPEGINSVSKIDTLSRLLFPLAFITFHIFYWLSYLDGGSVSAMFQSS